MKITGRLRDACPHGEDCARIHDTSGENVIVQGPAVTDADVLDELHLPSHERAVEIPRSLVHPEPMTLPEMGAWLRERHTRHRLRIENLRAYASASDGGDFARYLDGADSPTEGETWLERLRTDTAEGRAWAKVHITDGPLSDYERYEFEWGFDRTTRAGEQVRILDGGPREFAGVPDFTVIDSVHVVRSVYDDSGKFTGAYVVHGADAAVYRALADQLWRRATTFSEWWAAHPEAHRNQAA